MIRLMQQMTFADAEYLGKREQPRRECFLIEMNQVVPKGLTKVIARHHRQGRGSRSHLPADGDVASTSDAKLVR